MKYRFQWGAVWKVWPELAHGALITLEITVFSMVLGLLFGILLALAKRSDRRLLRLISNSWVEVARNTPALLQVYLAYFGLGAFGIHLSASWAVLVAIGFNNAGYFTNLPRRIAIDKSPAARRRALVGHGPVAGL